MRTGFGLQQVQSLRQTLVMTPKLQQAIKVMQMTSMDLQQHVDLELQENIFLEEGQDLDLEEEIQGEMKELESDDLEQKKGDEHIADVMRSPRSATRTDNDQIHLLTLLHEQEKDNDRGISRF